MRKFIEVLGKNIKEYGVCKSNIRDIVVNGWEIGVRDYSHFPVKMFTGETYEYLIELCNSSKEEHWQYKIYQDEFDYLKSIITNIVNERASQFLDFVECGFLVNNEISEPAIDSDMSDEAMRA